MEWLTDESLRSLFGDAMSNQVFQFGFAFTLAAFLHAGRVKREIAEQGRSIRDAFNDLALALRQDLSSQSERIVRVEANVDRMNGRIIKLEAFKGGTDGAS